MTFALGKKAYRICDRCGLRYPYTEMNFEWTNSIVCDKCFEEKHPQLDPVSPSPDAEALKYASPDRKEPLEVTVGNTFPPVQNNLLQAIGIVGQVRVSIT
jgi:hypothetical protein